MSPEQQRIAIAEACGWTVIEGVYPRDFGYRPGHPKTKWEEREPLPDYLHDLNAMHEAEEVLSDKQRPVYFEAICVVLKIPEGFLSDLTAEQMFAITCATAAQRAEAFLRVIGKWTE